MSKQRKRDYYNENKVFDTAYDPIEINKFEQRGHSIMDSSDFMLPQNTLVNFQVEIIEPVVLGKNNCSIHEANLYFTSFHAPNFEIPISYIVVAAPLNFDNLFVDFPASLPDFAQYRELNIKSNLDHPIYIKKVKSYDPSKVSIEILQNTLPPGEETKVIKISTVPFNNFNSHLKSFGLNLFRQKTADKAELMKMVNDPVLTYFDILAWQSEMREWDRMMASNLTDATTLVTIETNIVQSKTNFVLFLL